MTIEKTFFLPILKIRKLIIRLSIQIPILLPNKKTILQPIHLSIKIIIKHPLHLFLFISSEIGFPIDDERQKTKTKAEKEKNVDCNHFYINNSILIQKISYSTLCYSCNTLIISSIIYYFIHSLDRKPKITIFVSIESQYYNIRYEFKGQFNISSFESI